MGHTMYEGINIVQKRNMWIAGHLLTCKHNVNSGHWLLYSVLVEVMGEWVIPYS